MIIRGDEKVSFYQSRIEELTRLYDAFELRERKKMEAKGETILPGPVKAIKHFVLDKISQWLDDMK